MEAIKSFVCCECGNDFFTAYEHEGKIYCRHCLKAKLGVEEEITIEYHYPDGEELVYDNLDEIFMQVGVKPCI